MNILILRSTPNTLKRQDYSVSMDVHYADRVIGHLSDTGNYCKACQKKCITCRKEYDLDFSGFISGVIEVPAVLPVMLNEPKEYLPADIPAHELVVAISVHEEILLAFVERLSATRGLMA